MRAVITAGHGGREQLQFSDNYPIPSPAADEVLIRVAATALNFHDIFTRRGMPGIKVPLPLIVGSDIAGEVTELGADVHDWTAGARVLVNPVYVGPTRYGLIGESFDGGRAEYVAVAASQLIALPDNVSFDAAAALPLAYGTAHRMLVTRGQVKRGDTLLVLGASGGVGVACVQIGKLLGAEVYACASTDQKLARLAALGADHLINYQGHKVSAVVHQMAGKPRVWGQGGVDVAVNFTGGDTLLDTQKCVKLGGRILVCGATAGFTPTIDARYLWTFEHTIAGSNGWNVRDLTTLIDLVHRGQLVPAIDKILPLAEAAEAERMLEDREVVGKILLRPELA